MPYETRTQTAPLPFYTHSLCPDMWMSAYVAVLAALDKTSKKGHIRPLHMRATGGETVHDVRKSGDWAACRISLQTT